MSNKKKVVVKKKVSTTSAETSPTTSKYKSTPSTGSYTPVFSRENYIWMLGGIGLIIMGFLLMMGGGMPSPEVWDDSIIYSFRRITLAPFLIIAGLCVGVYSIFK